MKHRPPFRRINTARGHHYLDADGQRVTGATTILGAAAKDALINWAASATAEAAVNRWDELAVMPPAARLKVLQGARYEEKDRAANRGHEVHNAGERLVHGEPVEVAPEIEDHVRAYAQFLDRFKVQPVHVEFSVASYRYGYAGTADLIADLTIPRIGRRRMLLDLKTNRSGIFGETSLQLSAYRYADTILGDPDQPMLDVEDTGAIHIRADGADLVPVTTTPELHRTFLYLAQVHEFLKISKDLVGAPITAEPGRILRIVAEETS